MEIQQPQPTNCLFQSMSAFSIEEIYNQPIMLEGQFSPFHNGQQTILVTLTKNVILLSNLAETHISPHSALELTFDVKFQIIYETQKNIFSSKLGFKIFTSSNASFSFYSNQKSRVEQFIAILAKKINQNGFHQMFKPFKKLGKGNFASVYEVERLTDHRRFAVKAFSKQNSFSAKNGKESLINELNIMRELSQESNENVLDLEGVYESDNSIYVVLELLTGGQLFNRIQLQNGNFSEQDIKSFMAGFLNGIEHLHKNRIMHRDLKPQNIMLRSTLNFSPVLVDFGLATPVDIDKYLFFRCGTPGYVAPEIIALNQSKHIEPECDIFSAGVIFHILLTRKALFEGTKYDEVYKKNKQMSFNLEAEQYSKIDHQAMDLLKKMLKSNPQERIKAKNALQHSYFTGQGPKSPEKCILKEENEEKLKSPALTNISTKENEKKKNKKSFFNF